MNAYADPQVGGTGTSQYSPYQLEHGGDVAIFIDDCDNECHADAA